MRSRFSVGFRAWCVALAFGCAPLARAAEQHPLLGATREQVVAQNGEPGSKLERGELVIFFYPREKLTLRNGVVVDVERLAVAEPKQPSPPSPAPAETTPAPTPPRPRATPGNDAPPPPVETATSAQAEAPAGTTTAGAETAVPPAPVPESRVEIKRVLPRGATTQRPSPSAAAPTASAPTPPTKSAPPATSAPAPNTVSPASVASSTSAPVAQSATSPTATPEVPTPGPVASTNIDAATTPPPPSAAPAAEEASAETAKVDDATAKKKDAKKAAEVRAARRRLEQAEADAVDPTATVFTKRTYLIAFLIVGAGAGFLYWRHRQRQLALAASAVSRTPFNAPTAVASGTGAVFSAELLSKLEWKRFEELVAQYYSKTGVVATRTKSGPAAPVHIKISWKGEPRPFALVQCLAHPVGLIDAKPIQELQTVLMAEDIRRGYVVTTGKFNVTARDFAEEKHITLLPGDIFIEKLNALPDAARNEIMQAVRSGDYTTPSCPKCDAKMVRSPDDPAMYRCPVHAEQQMPAQK